MKPDRDTEPPIPTPQHVEPRFDSALSDSGPDGPAPPSRYDPHGPYGAFGDSTGTTTIFLPDESGVVRIERETYKREISDDTAEVMGEDVVHTHSAEEFSEALDDALERESQTGKATVIFPPDDMQPDTTARGIDSGVGEGTGGTNVGRNADTKAPQPQSGIPKDGEGSSGSSVNRNADTSPTSTAPKDGRHNCGPLNCWCGDTHANEGICSFCGKPCTVNAHWHGRDASPRCVVA